MPLPHFHKYKLFLGLPMNLIFNKHSPSLSRTTQRSFGLYDERDCYRLALHQLCPPYITQNFTLHYIFVLDVAALQLLVAQYQYFF